MLDAQAIMVEKKEKKGAGASAASSMGMGPSGMPAGLTM